MALIVKSKSMMLILVESVQEEKRVEVQRIR